MKERFKKGQKRKEFNDINTRLGTSSEPQRQSLGWIDIFVALRQKCTKQIALVKTWIFITASMILA